MSHWLKAGSFRICPLCEARNQAGASNCEKCRTPMGSAPAVALRAPARAGNPLVMRMLLIGGVLAAIAAGLVVRGVFNASLEKSVLLEEPVRAAGPEMAAAAPAPPPEVTGWAPGASAPAVETAPAWSAASFPVAPIQPPSDPSTSMVGIAPKPARARAELTGKRVFTNDDLVGTRGPDTPPPPTDPPPVPVQ